jgi:hypothetical protein
MLANHIFSAGFRSNNIPDLSNLISPRNVGNGMAVGNLMSWMVDKRMTLLNRMFLG